MKKFPYSCTGVALVLAACLQAAPRALAGDAPAPEGPEGPEAGEARLDETATGAFIADLRERFAKQPCVRARIEAQVDDELLGLRVEKGELLLKRPDKVLRRFGPPGAAEKAQMLDGALAREYNPARKKVIERDFSKAPRALGLLRAALTADLAKLQEIFAFSVYHKAGAEGAPEHWRLVLSPRPDVKSPQPYARVQARIDAGAPFFREIATFPKKGEGTPRLERYLDIRAESALTVKDFAEPLLDAAVKETEAVTDANKD